MDFGLLLLPSIGGYWFLTHFNNTQFNTRRESGHHLLFKSVIVGGLLYGVSLIIALFVNARCPWGKVLWESHIPGSFPIEVVLSIVLGFLLPLILNRLYGREQGARKAAFNHGDRIELLFADAVSHLDMVEVSLRNRKSYIGFPMDTGLGVITGEPEIALLPFFSGYRANDTLELRITIDYRPVLDEYREHNFKVVVPKSEVVTARLFNYQIFERFGQPSNPGEQDTNTQLQPPDPIG